MLDLSETVKFVTKLERISLIDALVLRFWLNLEYVKLDTLYNHVIA
jgi:hypothetical protein